MKRFFLILLGVTTVADAATVVQIPYAGGKQGGTVEVRTVTSSPPLPAHSTITTISFEVGDLFSIQFRGVAGQNPAGLCSANDAEYGKVFLRVSMAGTARQLADSGTNWQLHSIRPPDSALMPLAPLPLIGDSSAPIGFRFITVAYCEGEGQYGATNWNRLIFVQNGSRYAKLAIVAKQDTSWGILPSYAYLKTITFRYVVNDTNELSDPVAIRRDRSESRVSRLSPKMVYDLYNPLGVKLGRNPRRYEPALPARSRAR